MQGHQGVPQQPQPQDQQQQEMVLMSNLTDCTSALNRSITLLTMFGVQSKYKYCDEQQGLILAALGLRLLCMLTLCVSEYSTLYVYGGCVRVHSCMYTLQIYSLLPLQDLNAPHIYTSHYYLYVCRYTQLDCADVKPL